MELFERYSPFIQDFIYAHGWQELRPVQTAAAEVLFGTEDNLLLTSSTASGKTEAAFFPILSLMSEAGGGGEGFGVVYIAPLKSLINDQFARLNELCDLSGIPVYHWHGDVAASHKNTAAKNPHGILQITPESFEGMLMNRSNDIVRLFGSLQFVVLDELHILCGTDRGNQILCQLSRLGRLIGRHPRRVGLSATIGDVQAAADWLGAGSGRHTAHPVVSEGKLRWKLGMEHFYIQDPNADQAGDMPALMTAAAAENAEGGDGGGPRRRVGQPSSTPGTNISTTVSGTKNAWSSPTPARRPNTSPRRCGRSRNRGENPTASSSITAICRRPCGRKPRSVSRTTTSRS